MSTRAIITAPGKIILTGEHSVVYHGNPAVAGSIRNTSQAVLQVIPNSPGHIKIKYENFNQEFSFDLRSLLKIPFDINLQDFSLDSTHQLDSIDISTLKDQFRSIWQEIDFLKPNATRDTVQLQNSTNLIFFLIHGIFSSLDLEFSSGLHLNLKTELTIGAGSGSSASFSVCVAAALWTYIKIMLLNKFGEVENKINISKSNYKPFIWSLIENQPDAFLKQDKHIINKWAYLGEKITHGKPSGLDNTICTFGGMVKMVRGPEQNDIQILEQIYPLNILMVDSGVSRSTATLVQKVAELKSKHGEIISNIIRSISSVTNEFVEVLQKLYYLDQLINKDSKYKELFKTEFQKLEELVDFNQGLLSSLTVSHPKLDQIISICKRYELHAKLTGAGGGGYAFAIIPPDYDATFLDECIACLKEAGFRAENDIIGGPGLQMKEFNGI